VSGDKRAWFPFPVAVAEALVAALLGACGGVLYELVELARFLKVRGHFPWSRRGRRSVVRVHDELRRYESPFVYFVAVAIRGVVGAVVAAGLYTAGPLSPLAALVAGTGAYSVIDRWAASTPVNDGKIGPPVSAAAKAD
jgi:hypothetical protein